MFRQGGWDLGAWKKRQRPQMRRAGEGGIGSGRRSLALPSSLLEALYHPCVVVEV